MKSVDLTYLTEQERHLAAELDLNSHLRVDGGCVAPLLAFLDGERYAVAKLTAEVAALKAEREMADAAWRVFMSQESLLATRSVKYLERAFPEEHRATQDPNGRVAWVLRYRRARGLLDAQPAPGKESR